MRWQAMCSGGPAVPIGRLGRTVGWPSRPEGRLGREATRFDTVRHRMARWLSARRDLRMDVKVQNDAERCRILSLRDPTGAEHTVGPPELASREVSCAVAFLVCMQCLLFFSGCGKNGSEPTGASASNDKPIERTAEKGPVKVTVRVTPSEPR